ncbi:hypothetical protein [Absidia glauca]|uniref:F-box domain-containing protein n=1 Tax=Absidia glauca TaxID=4829 RepID=A0A163IUN0_ABSGL|nr:hypothetical protein [Absidia glauca]
MQIHFGQFPLEVLTVILGKVDSCRDKYQCTLVNKHFYKVMCRKLWQAPMQLDATHELEKAPQPIVRRLLADCTLTHPLRSTHLGQYVRKIRFNELNLVDTMMLCLTMMPLLKSLHLDYLSHVEDETIYHITVLCPRLKVLKLAGLQITDQALVTIGENCRLQSLEVRDCHRLTRFFLSGVRNSGLRKLSLMDVSDLTVEETARDICCMDRLTHLRLEGCYDIRNDFLQRLRTKTSPSDPHFPLPRLLFFALNMHAFRLSVSPVNLFEFANVHPALYHISASMSMVTEPMLTMIANVAPLLHKLTLHGTCHVFSAEVRNFIRRCKRLEYLVLWYCRLPARCFPEAQRLYDPAFPHFRLRAAELAKIRNNTHIDFSAEDDELRPSDEEEAWILAPLPRTGGQVPDLNISDDDDNSTVVYNDTNHNSDINGENELDDDDDNDNSDFDENDIIGGNDSDDDDFYITMSFLPIQ